MFGSQIARGERRLGRTRTGGIRLAHNSDGHLVGRREGLLVRAWLKQREVGRQASEMQRLRSALLELVLAIMRRIFVDLILNIDLVGIGKEFRRGNDGEGLTRL